MDRNEKEKLGRRVVAAMARLDRVGALPVDLDVEGWVDMDGDARSSYLHDPWLRSDADALDLPDVTRAATRGVLRDLLETIWGVPGDEPDALVRALERAADHLAPPRVSDELAAALASRPLEGLDRPLLDRVLAALREVGR